MNEAAAQLCFLLPALLTRRDELFPLARQVVRDSGYQYSKGHSRSQFIAGFPSKLLGGNAVPSANPNANGGTGGAAEGDPNSRDSSISGSGRKRGRLGSLSDNGEDPVKRGRMVRTIQVPLSCLSGWVFLLLGRNPVDNHLDRPIRQTTLSPALSPPPLSRPFFGDIS